MRPGLHQRPAAAQVAVGVVHPLEPVQVDEEHRERAPVAHRALRLAVQRVAQVARVVQPREVVGHRERLGLLQQDRVVEGEGHHAQQRLQERPQPRRQLRRLRARPAIEADQRHRVPPPPAERDRHHRRGRGGQHAPVVANVGGEQLAAFRHHPCGHGRQRRVVGVGAALRMQQRELARPVVGQQRPGVERDPARGVIDQQARDPAGVHVGVCLPHDLLERFTPAQSCAQRDPGEPETLGQVERLLARAARNPVGGHACHSR